MIALAGWSLIAAALAAVVAVVAVSRLSRIPHRHTPSANATVDDRVALIEGYLVESEQSWRANTRRTAVLVGTLVAVVILAVVANQDDRDNDRAVFRRFAYATCLNSSENREQQRSRDAREVARAEAALYRHDVAAERAIRVEDLPVELTPPDLVPLLDFLQQSGDERRALEREQLAADLAAAQRDAAEYIARFPIPACDPNATVFIPVVVDPEED